MLRRYSSPATEPAAQRAVLDRGEQGLFATRLDAHGDQITHGNMSRDNQRSNGQLFARYPAGTTSNAVVPREARREMGRYSAENPPARPYSFSRVAHRPADGVGMKKNRSPSAACSSLA